MWDSARYAAILENPRWSSVSRKDASVQMALLEPRTMPGSGEWRQNLAGLPAVHDQRFWWRYWKHLMFTVRWKPPCEVFRYNAARVRGGFFAASLAGGIFTGIRGVNKPGSTHIVSMGIGIRDSWLRADELARCHIRPLQRTHLGRLIYCLWNMVTPALVKLLALAPSRWRRELPDVGHDKRSASIPDADSKSAFEALLMSRSCSSNLRPIKVNCSATG